MSEIPHDANENNRELDPNYRMVVSLHSPEREPTEAVVFPKLEEGDNAQKIACVLLPNGNAATGEGCLYLVRSEDGSNVTVIDFSEASTDNHSDPNSGHGVGEMTLRPGDNMTYGRSGITSTSGDFSTIIPPKGAAVSRNHLIIGYNSAGALVVRDQGSAFGTDIMTGEIVDSAYKKLDELTERDRGKGTPEHIGSNAVSRALEDFLEEQSKLTDTTEAESDPSLNGTEEFEDDIQVGKPFVDKDGVGCTVTAYDEDKGTVLIGHPEGEVTIPDYKYYEVIDGHVSVRNLLRDSTKESVGAEKKEPNTADAYNQAKQRETAAIENWIKELEEARNLYIENPDEFDKTVVFRAINALRNIYNDKPQFMADSSAVLSVLSRQAPNETDSSIAGLIMSARTLS